MLNDSVVEENWKEFKDALLLDLPQINNEELEKTLGSIKEIHNLIERRYGNTEENYPQTLKNIFTRFQK